MLSVAWFVPVGPALAADPELPLTMEVPVENGWTFTAAPYFWMAGISGDVGVGRVGPVEGGGVGAVQCGGARQMVGRGHGQIFPGVPGGEGCLWSVGKAHAGCKPVPAGGAGPVSISSREAGRAATGPGR